MQLRGSSRLLCSCFLFQVSKILLFVTVSSSVHLVVTCAQKLTLHNLGQVTASLGLTLMSVINWKTMSRNQRGLAVTSILQSVMYILPSAKQYKLDPIRRINPGAARPFRRPAANLAAL